MPPPKKSSWRMRASIPLPRACKARALPFELIPRRLFAPVGIRYFTFSSILKSLLVYCQRYDYIVEKRKLFQFRESNNYQVKLGLATNSWGGFNIFDMIFPYRHFRTTFILTSRRLRNVDGGCGHRSRYLAHAKRALYHLS